MSDVDWNLAPAWANWWTQDRHGTCWFEVEPEYAHGCWTTPDAQISSRYHQIDDYDGGPVVAIMRRAGQKEIGRKEIGNRAEDNSGLPPTSYPLSSSAGAVPPAPQGEEAHG